MAATTPMFCLPYSISGASQVTIVFNDNLLGGTNIPFTLEGNDDDVLYNNRDFTHVDNLQKEFVDKVNAAETAVLGGSAGEWSVEETTGTAVDGTIRGYIKLTRTAGHVDDDIATITFNSPAIIAGSDFGFQSNAVAPSSGSAGATYTWVSYYAVGRLWIPHPVYPGCFMAHHEKRPVDFIVGTDPTTTPATALTQDYYGGQTFRRIHVMTINAASILDQYAADSEYLEAGQRVSDPSITWDAFRRTWRDATGDLK